MSDLRIKMLQLGASFKTTATLLATLPLLWAASPLIAEGTDEASLSGTVTYRADPDSPWRFQRYYVADQSTGALAEAVVSLKPTQTIEIPPNDTPANVLVDQENFQFIPETIAVRTGDRVRFTNSDETLHNVMLSHPADAFNVNLGKDEIYEHQFKSSVETFRPHRLGCVYHGSMRAWVFVYDHPFFALTGRDGSFQFKNVPPGEYQLEIHHAAGRLVWNETIKVSAKDALIKNIRLTPKNIKKRSPRK